MKNIVALFLLTTLVSFGYAQNGFQLGLRLSPNLSWIKAETDGYDNDGMKFGFNYGVIGDFNFAENYSFSTGITFASLGGKFKHPDVQQISIANVAVDQLGRSETDLTLKYVEIPLTLKMKTNEIGYMKYFGVFGVGLGVNYKAEADAKFTYSSNNANTSFTEEGINYEDQINLLRASLIVGLGAEYNLSGNTSVVFGATFNNGFTNMFSEDTYEADGSGNALNAQRDKNLKATNSYLLFNLGVIF